MYNLSVQTYGRARYIFRYNCATDFCDPMDMAVPAYEISFGPEATGSNATTWYIGTMGSATLSSQNYTAVHGVILADFTSLTGPIENLTFIPEKLVPATAGMFNVALPSITALYCNQTLARVNVIASFSQGVREDTTTNSVTLPWAVSGYNPGMLQLCFRPVTFRNSCP